MREALTFQHCDYECYTKRRRMYCRRIVPACRVITGEVLLDHDEGGHHLQLVYDSLTRSYTIYVDGIEHGRYALNVGHAYQDYWAFLDRLRAGQPLGQVTYERGYEYEAPGVEVKTVTTPEGTSYSCRGKQYSRGFRVYCRRVKAQRGLEGTGEAYQWRKFM